MDLSSDSEGDCYRNAAKKLANLRNKYQDDKIESTYLLDDSADINSETNSPNVLSEKGQYMLEDSADTNLQTNNNSNAHSKRGLSNSFDNVCSDSDEEYSDEQLKNLKGPKSKRVTRFSKKKRKTDSTILETSLNITNCNSVTSNRRSRKSNRNSLISVENERTPAASPRVRGRARGRGRGVRRTRRGAISNNIPTISIGNTMEYPDRSESQMLFSNNIDNQDVITLSDSDMLDENEELFLKIYWQSSEIFKFSIRKFQKLTTIFRHFAEKENVTEDNLLFTYNDKILKPDDTPDSIDYNIVKFIDGGIVNSNVAKLINNHHRNEAGGIKIKFQCQNVKKPLEIAIQADDKLSLAMMKCAEHLELPLNKLKFKFDGESISGTMTAKELELEDGECIDVKIMK